MKLESMFPQNNLVFIGNSLVSISQSVKKLNKRVINIDSFNDTDLVGENFINSDQRGYVNQDVLLVLEKLNLRKNDTLIVVSGEYDSDKDYYNALSEFGYIAGNKQSTIQEIYNHEKLFSKLSKNNIKFPKKISPDEAKKSKNFLKKNFYSSGGLGIQKNIIQKQKKKTDFYQAYIEGDVFSIIFISNKDKKFSIVGVNKIFSKNTNLSDFTFSGARSNVSLDKKYMKRLEHMINFFVSEYGLVGINGIDFIIKDDIYFLELNPRLTQTCFMYDDLFFNGFIEAHIEACAQNSISFNLKDRVISYAFETMFAKNSFKFNLDLDKFNFLMNIPHKNTFIEVGHPICTICIKSTKTDDLQMLLKEKVDFFKRELNNAEIV